MRNRSLKRDTNNTGECIIYTHTPHNSFVCRKEIFNAHFIHILQKANLISTIIPLTIHGHLRQNKKLKNIVKRPRITEDCSGSYC